MLKSADIAKAIGVNRKLLTGNGAGTLFLLEEEGLVSRTGRKKGTKWYLTKG
jgi:hypothetical protein